VVEAGVGAIATQSFVNKSFGIRGLTLLKSGKTAQETLDILYLTMLEKKFVRLELSIKTEMWLYILARIV
jgi:uncharacterized Ntn-hydrolase superfamily protein